jgi:hypothetical protein
MENKQKIVQRLEEAYKESRLSITELAYYSTPVGSEGGRDYYDEYVDVFVEGKSTPWITVNVTADSGAAMVYDIAKAILKRI